MLQKLKHFLIPNTGNQHKPGIFSFYSVVAVVIFLSATFSMYLVDVRLVISRNSFLAAILPTVLVYETNLERSRNSLSMVEMDNELNLAAQYKANDMAEKGYFAHVSPDGKTPWYWLDLSGYEYTYAGENLAANFDESTDVVNAWIASPTHHANLIKPQYSKMGIGIARGKLNGQDTTFVVQLFTTPRTKPASALARAVTPSVVAEASDVTPQITIPQPAPVKKTAEVAVKPVAKVVPKVATEKPIVKPAPITMGESTKTSMVVEKKPETTVVTAIAEKVRDDKLLLASLDKEKQEQQKIRDEHRKKIVSLVAQKPIAPSIIEEVLASPRQVMTLLLEGILILTMLMFVATTVAGMKLPHKDVIISSLAVSGFAVLLLLVIASKTPEVLIPSDTMSASVVKSL